MPPPRERERDDGRGLRLRRYARVWEWEKRCARSWHSHSPHCPVPRAAPDVAHAREREREIENGSGSFFEKSHKRHTERELITRSERKERKRVDGVVMLWR